MAAFCRSNAWLTAWRTRTSSKGGLERSQLPVRQGEGAPLLVARRLGGVLLDPRTRRGGHGVRGVGLVLRHLEVGDVRAHVPPVLDLVQVGQVVDPDVVRVPLEDQHALAGVPRLELVRPAPDGVLRELVAEALDLLLGQHVEGRDPQHAQDRDVRLGELEDERAVVLGDDPGDLVRGAGDELRVPLDRAEEALHPGLHLLRRGPLEGPLEVLGGDGPPVVELDALAELEGVGETVLGEVERLGHVELGLRLGPVEGQTPVDVLQAVVVGLAVRLRWVVGDRRVLPQHDTTAAPHPAGPRRTGDVGVGARPGRARARGARCTATARGAGGERRGGARDPDDLQEAAPVDRVGVDPRPGGGRLRCFVHQFSPLRCGM